LEMMHEHLAILCNTYCVTLLYTKYFQARSESAEKMIPV